jgi:hypothetical protein
MTMTSRRTMKVRMTWALRMEILMQEDLKLIESTYLTMRATIMILME